MSAKERFDAALAAWSDAQEPEYEIDPAADALRVTLTGDTYSWVELPDHVRDYWREEAARVRAAEARQEKP